MMFVLGSLVATLSAQKSETKSRIDAASEPVGMNQEVAADGGNVSNAIANIVGGLRFARIDTDAQGCNLSAVWTANEVFDTLTVRHPVDLVSVGFGTIANLPIAAGATTWVDAASGATKGIYECGRFHYERKNGRCRYTCPVANGVFDRRCVVFLQDAIDFINGKNVKKRGAEVNCTDCASFVTSFANLLGCSLYSSIMCHPSRDDGTGFYTNPYCAIGSSSVTPPDFGWGFSYHEVTWEGGCGDSDRIFDACLRVDGDSNPEEPPYVLQYAVGIPFSDGNPAVPLVYREKLTPNSPDGYYSCTSCSEKKIRRELR